MKLNQKCVLITGGSSGAGLGIARRCAEEGAVVVIVARDREKLEKAAADIGHNVRTYPGDVAERAQMQDVIRTVVEREGKIDILINCAGFNTQKRGYDVLSPEEWDRIMTVNATGAFNCIHAVLPHMRKRKEGLIISISSSAGMIPEAPAGSAYSASKHAMSVLTKIAGTEAAADGVRSTVISPGRMNTPYLDTIPGSFSKTYRDSVLQPEDIAETVIFVASLPARVSVPEIVLTPAHIRDE